MSNTVDTPAIRERKIAEVQAAVVALCEEHNEEDIIVALSVHCSKLSDEISKEGNSEAASYWKGLAQRLLRALVG